MTTASNWADIKRFDPLIFTDGAPLYTRTAESLNKAFESTVDYLDWTALAQCALVSRHFNSVCNKRMWRAPSFWDGYLHGALHLFNRFVDLLPHVRPQVGQLVTQLNLSEIEETLYENVRPHFFDFLRQYTPNLQILNMSKTSFLSPSSMASIPRDALPYLRALDLSFCDHISDELLIALAPALPRLQYLRLDSLGSGAGGGERGLAAFADACDELSSVSIRYNPTITDGSLMALAKFGKIRVKEVDLTGCSYVNDTGLATMARFNINLQYLSLAKTACSADTAEMFLVGRSSRFLRHMDLGFCSSLDPQRTAICLWSNTTLKQLAVSMPVACAMLTIGHAGANLCPCPLEFFVVHDVPENTPIQLLNDLVVLLPNLKHIAFTQDIDEMESYMSFYSDSSKRVSPLNVISKDSVRQFNLGQSRVLATITNDREKIEGLTLHYW